MSETQIQPGGNRVPSETRVAVDETTIRGDGSSSNPLRVVGGGGSAFAAMASIANAEGAILIAGYNVESVNYDGTKLSITLIDGVQDHDKVCIQVTPQVETPITDFWATMPNVDVIEVNFADADGSPILVACYVTLVEIP